MQPFGPLNTDAPVETPTREAPKETREPTITVQWLPLHKVILHNNDHTPMELVVATLMRAIPGCGWLKATRYMMTAHLTGAAVVFRGDVEEAEAIAGRIRTIGVKVTVEPDV